jgi:peptidyl-dipeptidase A
MNEMILGITKSSLFQGIGTPKSDKNHQPVILSKSQDVFAMRFGRALNPTEQKAKAFVDEHGEYLAQLGRQAGVTGFEFYTQGGEALANKYEQLQMASLDYVKDPQRFAEASALQHDAKNIRDRVLRRELDLLYRTFQQGSMSPEIQEELVKKGIKLEELRNSFRATVDGQTMGDQDLQARFKKSTDPADVKALWEAKHAVGVYQGEVSQGLTVAEQIVDMVKTRNRLARENGCDNYFSMSLRMQDINERQLVKVMQGVKAATEEPYANLMARLDQVAKDRFHLSDEQMKDVRLPWFQGNSGNGSDMVGSNLDRLFQVNPDTHFIGKDAPTLVEKTANLMGNSVRWIFDKSSLYYEPDNKGKSQHWFLFSIEPKDVRVLANIDKTGQNNMAFATSTMFHETLGHGLDYGQQDAETLHPMLIGHHAITTEANAMLHEDLMGSEKMHREVLGLSAEDSRQAVQKAKPYYEAQHVAVLRSILAIIDFERDMYKKLAKNPNTTLRELNDLWWKKQQTYLLLKRPEGREEEADWARVPHYSGLAAYYQNYLLADVQRAQELAYIHKTIKPSAATSPDALLSPEAGTYLKHHRALGLTYTWKQIVKRMTGEILNPEALAAEFKGVF